MKHAGPARSISLYFLAILVVSGANFLSVPILVLLLGHDEFGRWALLEPLLLTLLPMVGLGVHLEVLRRAGSADSVASLLPVALGSAPVLGLFAGLCAFALGLDAPTITLLGLAVALEGVLAFFVSVWRAQERPGHYASIEGGRAVILLAALSSLLFFMPGTRIGTADYLLLRIVVAIGALSVALIQLRPSLAIHFPAGRSAVRYGLPIVLASTLSILLLNVDRYTLAFHAEVDVPSYVAHVRLAYVLVVAASAFSTWFAPAAMRRLNEGERAHGFFIGSTSAYVCAVLLAAGNMWFLTPKIWPLLFPTLALDLPLFAWLLAGATVFCLANPLSLGSLAPGKTHQALIATASAVAAAIVASWPLAEALSATGAAIARGVAVFAYVGLFATITVSVLGIRYPWMRYFGLAALAAGLCFALDVLVRGDDWISLGARMAIFSGVVCGIVALGYRQFGR